MGNSNRKHEKSEDIGLNSMNNLCYRPLPFNKESDKQINLIWFDQEAKEYSSDSIETRLLLKDITKNKLILCDQWNDFLNQINQRKNEDEEVLVIISGSYALQFLPFKENITEKIIIFCKDYFKYSYLKNKYSNIVDVCNEHSMLKSSLFREIPLLKSNLFINRTLKTSRLLSFREDQHSHNDDHHFSYIFFIEILKQMQKTEQSKECMLNQCQVYYRNNVSYLKHIDRFRQSYKSTEAIDWYIHRSSFLSQIINQSFRTDDVLMWYSLRYYIVDLCKQLEIVHNKQIYQSSFTVYRGQPRMSIDEIEELRINIGGTISINGFLSTSKDINVARVFITDVPHNDHSKAVLFQIFVDPNEVKNAIFVDINQYLPIRTKNNDEAEVLFNIGTIFRIKSVQNDGPIIVIEMEVTDQGTNERKKRIENKMKQYETGNMNLLFGDLLFQMKEYSIAEIYFKALLQLFPSVAHDEDRPVVYHYIGELNMRMTNYNEAWKYFNLSYQIKQDIYSSNHPQIAMTLNSIGNYYKAIGNHSRALEFYLKASQCKLNPSDMARTKLNISTIHMLNKDYEKAIQLCIEARQIFREYDPHSSEHFICCRAVMGDIHFAQKNYDKAELFYRKTLQINQTSNILSHYDQIKYVKGLAYLYSKQGKNEQAIHLCSDYLNKFKQHSSSNPMNSAHLLMTMSEFYPDDQNDSKILLLEQALDILEKNSYFEYNTIANCLTMIAKSYQKQHSNDIANQFYNRAIQIRKIIYPENHPTIEQIQHSIGRSGARGWREGSQPPPTTCEPSRNFKPCIESSTEPPSKVVFRGTEPSSQNCFLTSPLLMGTNKRKSD